MKKITNDKVKKKISKFFDGIDWFFQTNNFDKTIIYKKEDNDDLAAEIYYEEKYQRIEVSIYPLFFTKTLEEQRKMLLHELCHSFAAPSKLALYNFLDGKFITPDRIKEINETETSKIENILDGLLRDRLKYAKIAYGDYLK